MVISTTDLQLRYSGGGANSDPLRSYGGAMSSTIIKNGTLDNLFDSSPNLVTGRDYYDYRAIYVLNTDESLPVYDLTIGVDHASSYGSSIRIGTQRRNAQQNIIFSDFTQVTSGYFVLKYGEQVTSQINWNADATIFRTNIRTALRAIDGLSDVIVDAPVVVGDDATFSVNFVGKSGYKWHPTLVIADTSLATVSDLIDVTIAVVTLGTPINDTATTIAFTNNTPNGVTFASTPIQIGTLFPGERFYIWIERCILSTAQVYYNTLTHDAFSLFVVGNAQQSSSSKSSSASSRSSSKSSSSSQSSSSSSKSSSSSSVSSVSSSSSSVSSVSSSSSSVSSVSSSSSSMSSSSSRSSSSSSVSSSSSRSSSSSSSSKSSSKSSSSSSKSSISSRSSSSSSLSSRSSSKSSSSSNTWTPGSTSYSVAGTYLWTAPANVTSVLIQAVGAGGNGAAAGGGGGAYLKTRHTVVPGNAYTVYVGASNNPITGFYHGGDFIALADNGEPASGGSGGWGGRADACIVTGSAEDVTYNGGNGGNYQYDPNYLGISGGGGGGGAWASGDGRNGQPGNVGGQSGLGGYGYPNGLTQSGGNSARQIYSNGIVIPTPAENGKTAGGGGGGGGGTGHDGLVVLEW